MLYDLNLTKVFSNPKMIKIQHGAVNCKQLQNSNAAKLKILLHEFKRVFFAFAENVFRLIITGVFKMRKETINLLFPFRSILICYLV